MFDLCSRVRTRLFTILLSTQFREIGEGSRIVPPFRFSGLGQISVGKRVIVHRGCWIHVLGRNDEEIGPKIIIKSHAGIGMGATISAARQVVIGEYALLARNVYISDHSHAFENIAIPITLQGIDSVSPVSIGRGAWLGQNVVVLPGVTIGKHCVIGANSVVNCSIPDFSVAVGAPARVIKRFNQKAGVWERIENNQE